MSTYRNLITLCFAAVFTLGLAACGGGGDGTPTTTMPDPDPVAVEQNAINDAIDAAAAAAALVTDAATDEVVGAADMAVAAAMTAIDGASHITAGAVTAARARLATISGQLTAAKASRTMTMDLASQRMAISDALAAARTAVDAVMDDSDDATVEAADAAVTAATAAIEAAGDIPSSEAATARGTVAGLQSDLDDAKESRQMAMDAADEEERMAREAAQRRTMQLSAITSAIGAANTAVAAVNDTSDDATVTAADNAVQAARDAIMAAADVSEADLASHTATVDGLEQTLTGAKSSRRTAMDADTERTNQRNAINSAIAMARTAVAGVNDDSTDSEVASAEAAVEAARDAVEAGTSLADDLIAAHTATVTTLESQLNTAKESRMAAMEDEDEEERMANAALGRAMHAALGGPATGNALANIDTATTPIAFTATGALTIDAADQAGSLTTDPASVDITAGDSVASLGSWAGTSYARTTGTGTSKVTNEAVVYNNKGAAGSQPFSGARGKYTLITTAGATLGHIELGTGDHPVSRAMASDFLHTGTQNHPIPTNNVALMIRGTYDGAPGQFRCTGTCTSTNDGKGSPSALGGTWHFKPDSGAMVSLPDANYLYYGWWVSKDNDGDPTAASAFTGLVGTIAVPTSGTDSPEDLAGSATYSGHAAGKFALSNALDGTGSGGHFTADATLTAKFGAIAAPNNGGISGTIDNFRLNDGSEDPGWSVSLNRAPWGTAGAFASVAADNTNATAEATVWSIDGNSAGESGSWSGQMYDELPGNTTDTPAGDGNTTPTTVTGTFYSEFSTIGRMVGAFGANKQ